MSDARYCLVDVFTTSPFGGNPLAVFPDARDLDPSLFQSIAKELNLSETTFVLPPTRNDCDVRVRIFTPTRELPMAGHPTVGTAFVLDRGDRIVFEEGVGPVPVERVGASRWRMTQPEPRFAEPVADIARVAEALGLRPDALARDLPVQCVSTGVPFLLVPLAGLDALARLSFRHEAFEAIRGEALGVYAFARTGAGEVRCRMVGVDGIAEDPATGSAAGPLGAYLVRHGAVPAGAPARVLLRQGVEMGRPSEIHVEIEGSATAAVRVHVAGDSVTVGHGVLSL